MFILDDLPYSSYDALEPYMDNITLEIHYNKHHKSYADKLNIALEKVEKYPKNIRDLLVNIDMYDNTVIRNNAGGYYNHNLFWKILSANPIQAPNKQFKTVFKNTFGSVSNFMNDFTEKAMSLFGSGWTWLCIDRSKQLHIINTPNQDNPLMSYKRTFYQPLLGLDLWEHAYYLKHQNRRIDYINSFWRILNWDVVSSRYMDFCDYHGLVY